MDIVNFRDIILNNSILFFITISTNLLFITFFIKISNYISIVDKPDNVRKIHTQDVPLLGGLIIIINLSIWFIYNFSIDNENSYFMSYREIFSFYILSIFIFLLGLYDDKYSVKAKTKLLILTIILTCSILVDTSLPVKEIRISFIDISILTNESSIFFTILCFLLFINALNMFDGINLQVGTYCIIIFIYFALNNIALSMSLVMIIALLFFLYLNFKNKIFLGDSGSLLLAYIIGYIFVKYYNLGLVEDIETIFIMMMIPGIDMFRLFLTRIYSGKNAFHADSNHIHHIYRRAFKKKSFFIIQMIILLPVIIYLFILKSVLIIICSVLIYLLSIYFLNNFVK
ncbi:undecaprenyl/decaprenyl-phosphate alpha-N-acetylglucosaminyl 1-phosphate transferase [Pelagibacteraceae bacterium]|nr:undecaprenyl/decaprenyl-phosphate alpha-N-acetylglucosaminyl 1-phosphate transferase [Pelagibacteraceae bacterium]